MRKLNIISYYGGKYYYLDWLYQHFPVNYPELTYIEVFGGGGSVLLNKKKSRLDVYNDLESDVVNLFRVLRDKEKNELLKFKFENSVCSREEYNLFIENRYTECNIENAYRFLYICTFAFSGKPHGKPGFGISKHNSRYVNVLLNRTHRFDELYNRLRQCGIENESFEKLIQRYDSHQAFFYLDPPYVMDSRSVGKGYKHEMSNSQHELLCELLNNIQGKYLLSGYDNEIYEKNLKYMDKTQKEVLNHSHLKLKNKINQNFRTEILWANYNFENHDNTQQMRQEGLRTNRNITLWT